MKCQWHLKLKIMFASSTNNKKQYSVFRDLNSRVSANTEIEIAPLRKLSIEECSTMYRNSPLARKIVNIYPREAYNLGYKILDDNGNILEQDNEIILKSFLNASIYARIYGHCFIYYQFNDNSLRTKPVTLGAKPVDYKLFYNMIKKADFWQKENFDYHKDRIVKFTGVDAFLPLDNQKYFISEQFKSDSIFDSLVQSLFDEFTSKTYGKHILENLSYLLVGMKGLSSRVATTKGKGVVDDRMNMISEERDMSRVFSFDLDNEKIEFITQSLNGVRDMIQEFKEAVSVASEYPYDKLFEKPPAQSMGGSGMQNQLVARFLWVEKIHDWAKFEWKDKYIELFNRIYGVDAYTFELPFKFNMTDLERAELENIAADRTTKLVNAGIITETEARTSYLESKFTLNLALMSPDEFEKYKEEKAEKALEIANGQNTETDENDINDNNNNGDDSNEDSLRLASLSLEDWRELSKVNFDDMSEYINEFVTINNAGGIKE